MNFLKKRKSPPASVFVAEKKGRKFLVFGLVASLSFFALFIFSINSSSPFLAKIVRAAATFNNHKLDFQTLRASNYTKHPDSTTNWSTEISADAGDVVSLTIYYHNTSTENAHNVKAKVSVPQTASSQITASGSLWADGVPAISGQAKINISSSQSITYIPGSARWYPNQSQTPSPFPFGQSGDEFVTGGGVNLGTVGPGWKNQGSVVARFKVSESIPSVSVDIKANGSDGPVTLSQGQNLQLSWTSIGALSCYFSQPANLAVNTSGSLTYGSGNQFYPSPFGTTYTIFCYDGNLFATDSVLVYSTLPDSSVDITANGLQGPVQLIQGQSFSLEWVSSNASKPCILEIVGVGSSGVETSGVSGLIAPNHPFYPPNNGSRTFNITCATPSGGEVSDFVVVLAPVHNIVLSTQTQSCVSVSLSWYHIPGAQTFKIYRDGNLIATVPTSFGNNFFYDNVQSSSSYSYQVIANNGSVDFGHSNISSASTFSCPPSIPPAPTLSAATSATCGGNIDLSWNSVSDATSYKIFRSGVLIATVTNTSYTDTGLSPNTSYSYTVKASNSAGDSANSNQASAKSSIACVTPPSAPTLSAVTSATCGGIIDLSWNSVPGATSYKVYRSTTLIATVTDNFYTDTGLTPGQAYSYNVKASNSAGDSAFSNVVSAVASAKCITTPNAPSITSVDSTECGGIILISWSFVEGATEYKLFRGGVLIKTTTDLSYKDTGLIHGASYTYFVKASNSAGDSSESNSITTNASQKCPVPPPPTPIDACKDKGFDFTVAKWEWKSNSYVKEFEKSGYNTSVSGDTATAHWTSNPAIGGIVSKEGAHLFAHIGGTAGSFTKSGVHDISFVAMCGNNIVVPEEPTVTLTANPDSILKGQNSILSWTSTNAKSCSATWTTSVSVSGSQTVSPQSTTTYTITCTGHGGSATGTATVTVTEPQCLLPEITSILTATGKVGNGFSYTITASSSKPVTFSVATSSLPAGISWSGNTISGTPTEHGTFNVSISATNECGTDTETLTITISPADIVHPAPTVTLTANPDSILKGQNSILSWTSTNAKSCSATWTTSVSVSGSQTVSPQSTTTYTITCTGHGGSATGTATVTVTEPVDDTVTVSLTADPSNINQGQSSTLTWISNNAITCSAVWTTATSTAGNQLVTPNTTTEYSITCSNNTKSATATTTIGVIAPPIISEPPSGGGGGGSSSSRRRVAVPEVLGVATCEYLRDYLRIDWRNDPIEVIKLQAFLKSFEGFENLEINGVFDQATFDAVAIFQERYFDDILSPWGHDRHTGFVYILTKKKINEIYCQRAFPLNESQEEEIRLFRAFLETLRAQGIEVPSSLDNGTPVSGTESSLIGDISDQDRESIIETVAGISDVQDTTPGGLIRNPAVRNVASAVFAGPDGWADAMTAIVILFLVVLIIHLAVNAVVKKNGSITQVQAESLKIKRWMLFVGGLIIAIIGCFIFKYYVIVLPLIALIIAISSLILWKVAFRKEPAITQAPLLKIDDK